MSGYKLADGTLSTDYKEGQAFKFQFTPEQSDKLNSYWSTASLNGTLMLHEDDGTNCPEFECIETGETSYEEWTYLASKQSNSQPTYTQSELSYISELEDRVEYLESLCSDLAEHIKDVEYKLEQGSKALSKWFKLTQLVSENNKVADLIGARLGDNVNDIIYDYLLSRVK